MIGFGVTGVDGDEAGASGIANKENASGSEGKGPGGSEFKFFRDQSRSWGGKSGTGDESGASDPFFHFKNS